MCLVVVPTRDNAYAYTICVMCSLACSGSHFSLFPALCGKVFGKVNGGLIFTFLFFAIPISGNVIIEVYHALHPHYPIFYILAGTTAFNMILLYFFDPTPLIDGSKNGAADSSSVLMTESIIGDDYDEQNLNQTGNFDNSMEMKSNRTNSDVMNLNNTGTSYSSYTNSEV